MHTTHTQKIIPIAPYLARPARWRLETPTERQERIRRSQMVLDGLRPRVVRLAEYLSEHWARWSSTDCARRAHDALEASHGHSGPEGAA